MLYSNKNEQRYISKHLKVALVHDWLVTYRGGEKVLESLGKLFPEAPIYTLFYDSSKIPSSLRDRKVIVPPALNLFKKFRKTLLPILPSLMEAIDLSEYDLIISSSSCVAKGAFGSTHSKHLSYIHSPMRYIWDQRKEYFQNLEKIPILRTGLSFLLSQLRLWDHVSAQRIDTLIANSHFVKKRISKFYNRDSKVIHPPIALSDFYPEKVRIEDKENYFLIAGAFVPYKRFDLAIESCKRLKQRLIVAGSGPGEAYLRSIAGQNVEFIIAPEQKILVKLMQKAQALIFPGIEDFGMVPIEAMASGTPVIAYRGGGALDYVEDRKNGLYFNELSSESLQETLSQYRLGDFDLNSVMDGTKKFSEQRFLHEISDEIVRLLGEK